MSRNHLLVLDGPGGPRPPQYLAVLGAQYDITVLTDRSQEGFDQEGVPPGLGDLTIVPDVPRREYPSCALDVHRRAPVAGVVSYSELPVVEANRIARSLDLPRITEKDSEILRNKFLQRQALEAAGLPVPAYARVTSEDDLKAAVSTIGFPAVLKPQVGAGSMATYAVRDEGDAVRAWCHAKHQLAADHRADPGVPLLYEAEIPGIFPRADPRLGDFVSVESVVADGEIFHLAVTDKLRLSPPYRENGEMLPSVLPGEVLSALHEAADAAIEALGLRHTCTHIEFKLSPSGPVVIEANSRIGGGIAELVKLTSGYDLISAAAAVACGRPVPALSAPNGSYAAFYVPQPPEGRYLVEAIPDPATLRSIPGVWQVAVNYRPGDIVDSARGTSSCTLSAYVTSKSYSRLLDIYACLSRPDLFSLAPIGDAGPFARQ